MGLRRRSRKEEGGEKKQAVGKNKLGPRHKGYLSIVHDLGLIRMAKRE